MSQNPIADHFQNSLAGLTRAVQSEELQATVQAISRAIAQALRNGNKVLDRKSTRLNSSH